MKNKKILTSFVLMLSIFSLFTLNVNSESAIAFTDVATQNEFSSAITDLKDSGIVAGYSDGTYKPDAFINRAEFTKILIEAVEQEPSGSDCFNDVADQWFAPYICKAKELGYVNGYPNGSFGPERNVNFAEASKMITKTYGLIAEGEDSSVWFKNDVLAMQDYSAIPTTVLSFDKFITRAEMAEMIYRIKNGYTEKAFNTFDSISAGKVALNDTSSLQNFRSCEQIQAYLSSPAPTYRYSDYDYALPVATESADSSVSKNESTSPGDTGDTADDFSGTNVQVAGVDESDIVKTDGEYIYVVKSNTIKIVDAKPVSNMKEIASVSFDATDFYPSEMYVSDNKLTVVGSYYGTVINPYNVLSKSTSMPYYGGQDLVKVLVYDVTNKNDIKLEREFSTEGNLVSTRKIGDMLYLVSNKYEYYYYPYEPMPVTVVPSYIDSAEGSFLASVSKCEEIGFIPGPSESKTFLSIFGISVADSEKKVTKKTVIASGNNVYASTKNLYVAEAQYNWNYRIMGDIYSNEEKTIVHKFSLGGDAIEYEGKGSVPGTILNQFSMDESADYFRIATTKGDMFDSNNSSKNNVYVLDSKMNTVGSLEGLAPGEKIYSVRFMGEKVYMVTFKKVDPLFVISLKDPKNPIVLGKLKIPGYSDYLHPYDENHIIGFGKDADDASEDDITSRDLDFAWYQGIKIAMFDVSDVNSPKEMFKVVIGDRGTESELLWNHKALLFDKAKGIFAFPVTVAEISDAVKNDPTSPSWTYGDPVFQGAYVYDVSLDKGFVLKGKISHYAENEVASKSGYYWYGDNNIERVLYIGDVLYTVSKGMVKANSLSSLVELAKTELSGITTDYWNIIE